MSTDSTEYPQHLRSAWADASAKKSAAIWLCVDARRRMAGEPPGPNLDRLQAELDRLTVEKDAAIKSCMDARTALDAAEAVFYGGA